MKAAGREVPIVWNGRRVKAFVPAPLATRSLDFGIKTAQLTATAAAEVGYAAGGLAADYEPLARLLLRAEGVASSYIEGVRAPIADVVLAEEAVTARSPEASWVAANLAALTDAVAQAQTGRLSVGRLCDWHRTLMTGSPTPERYVGVIRSEQGWIGRVGPTTAALVTPPPGTLRALLQDLVTYANRKDVDPIAQAAVAHAQFEVIHPFADGNGRVGRVLVAWVLTRRLQLVVPPPVSVAMAADVGGYFSGLALFRLGDHEPWFRWFADAIRRGGQAQQQLIAEVNALRIRWRERLSARGLRRDAAAWQILELMPRHLILTTAIVEQAFAVTNKAANAALAALSGVGILTEHGTVPAAIGRPPRLYVSQELLALAGASPLR